MDEIKESAPVKDGEKTHSALTREAGVTDVAFRADTYKGDCLKKLAVFSGLCPWLRRYLSRQAG